MMKYFYILTILFAISCTKSDPDELGNHTLQVQLFHHAAIVPHIDVYLMEYAETFPGDDLSEYHFRVMSDEFGKARFNKMLAGHHWIYGYGWDGQDTVKGNKPIYIDPHDADGVTKVVLNVSEIH